MGRGTGVVMGAVGYGWHYYINGIIPAWLGVFWHLSRVREE